MGKSILGRIYVWEVPVRFYHWMNVLAILVLSVTGYIIARPPAVLSASEAYRSYWFGTVRFVHFVAAYVFAVNFAVRIYWGFVGNAFANWKNFFIYNKRQFKQISEVLKIDVLLGGDAGRIETIGHNPLAGFSYFLTFLAFLFQTITGFGIYSAMSDAWFPRLFRWVPALMGGDLVVRQWHHLFMWIFIFFMIHHVYFVFYHDYVEGRGILSSMAGGWKFIEKRCKPDDVH